MENIIQPTLTCLVIEKFQQTKIWTAAYYEAEHKAPYLKRFYLEAGNRRNLLGDNPKNSIYLLTDECYPRIEIIFGGIDSFREPIIVEAEEFVVARGVKARGKRLTTHQVETINELEPTRYPETPKESEPEETTEPETVTTETPENPEDVRDEIMGQMKL